MLPIFTSDEDIISIVEYLKIKGLGVTLDEAKAVINKKLLDSRKMSAYRQWKIIEDEDGKIKLGEIGVIISRSGENIEQGFIEIINSINPYKVFLEYVYNQDSLNEVSTAEVMRHWHQYYQEEISNKEDTANSQVICFFRICEGAKIGKVTQGRKGTQTRLDINREKLKRLFYKDQFGNFSENSLQNPQKVTKQEDLILGSIKEPIKGKKKVYISHGKNRNFLEPISDLLEIADLDPVVSVETESVSKPLPEKILSEMKECSAAIIHIEDEMHVKTDDGKDLVILNPNVLIEIGIALALFNSNFILLVKEGVELPSNLMGLYETRYSGDVLEASDAIKLIKAIKEL